MALVFISYGHADEEFVIELSARLERAAHSVWIDKEDLRIGDSLPQKIAIAINRADCVVAVISRASLASRWCQEEIRLSWNREIKEGGVILLPIRLDDSQPPDFLPTRLFADFRSGQNREVAFEALLRSIGETHRLSKRKLKCVLAVGSALAEDFLTAEPEKVPGLRGDFLRLDEKYMVEDRFQHFGGSGVNFTIRLTKAGHPVLPIISVGDDEAGRRIQQVLVSITRKQIDDPFLTRFIESPAFLCAGQKTSQAIVLSIQRGSRTTFTPRLLGVENFAAHFNNRIGEVTSSTELDIAAVMLGHIHADGPDLSHGELTRQLVNRYAGKSLTFANFGVTQLDYGAKFWRQALKKVSVLQFSLPEVRMFFSRDYPAFGLPDIIEWFLQENLTAVITYRNLDIIATCSSDTLAGKVIFARPFAGGLIVDTTGAGDAFASGMVSALKDEIAINTDTFSKALAAARIWGAFACTTYGGSKSSPTAADLRTFAQRGDVEPIDIKTFAESRRLLEMIDKATTPTLSRPSARSNS